jgi:putative lysine transport system permease protein
MDPLEQVNYLLSHYGEFFLKGLGGTILLSIIGTVGGLILGIPLALGENIAITDKMGFTQKAWRHAVRTLSKGYSLIVRGTPMMVQAMIFKYGCQAAGLNWNDVLPGMDVFDGWMAAGLIVITFNTAAYMAEVVRSGLNGIDKGQEDGARSLGLTKTQTLLYVTLPQALRNSIPTIGNEWIVNIKDSSVLNVIGVSELYFESSQAAYKGYMFVAAYIIVAVIYLILTLLTTGFLRLVEKKMDGDKFNFSLFHFRGKENA